MVLAVELEVPVVEVVDEERELVPPVEHVDVGGEVIDVRFVSTVGPAPVYGLVVVGGGPRRQALAVAVAQQLLDVYLAIVAALVKVDDKRLQLRAQLTVDVDVDVVQDGSAPAIQGGVVQDADGDQRRRRLQGPGRP